MLSRMSTRSSLVTAAMVPPLRQSSRIRQQMKSPSEGNTTSTASSSNKRRSRRHPRQKTSSSKATTSTPMAPFPLFKLPREIRDMIYAVLVSAGDLSIMRTCHEVNSEVQSRFYREAICRKGAGYCVMDDSYNDDGYNDDSYDDHNYYDHNYYDHRYYNPSSIFQAQNFELLCNLDSSPTPDRSKARTMQTSRRSDFLTFRSASSFGRGDIRRKQMIIELKFGAKTSLSEAEDRIVRLFDKPESFVGFQLLVVKLLSMPRGWSVAGKTRIGLLMTNTLEPALGAAFHYEGKDDDGECIKFRPWSLVGSQNHRLEPVWFIKKAVWDSGGRDSLEGLYDD